MQQMALTEDEVTIIHDEGKQSFSRGLALDQCPYADERSEHWTRGFLDAEAKFSDVSKIRTSARSPDNDENFVSRLWRGKVGLGKTYWLYGVILPFLASLVINAAITSFGAQPSGLQDAIAVIWFAYYIFISIAIWRAATALGPITAWGIAARCVVTVIPAAGVLAAILIPALYDQQRAVLPSSEPAVYSSEASTEIEPFLDQTDANNAAAFAISLYPFLDADSPAANQLAIDETINLRDQFIAEGYTQGTAIRMAAEIVGPKYVQ